MKTYFMFSKLYSRRRKIWYLNTTSTYWILPCPVQVLLKKIEKLSISIIL